MKPEPMQYMRRTRESYEKLGFEPYQWFHADTPAPFVLPQRSLAQSRVGMISTAGTYALGQRAFHYRDDTGVRAIPASTPIDELRFSHIMENYLEEARQDPCTVFPIDALSALRQDGTIGALAEHHFSCMGGIYSQRRVRDELIPGLEAAVARERLDLLFLVPL